MCGLSGFVNVPPQSRAVLVDVLGAGIEGRGDDAAGYVAVNGVVRYGKTLGGWSDTHRRFRHAASIGEVTMMHARAMTCGIGGVDEAHPFCIRRGNETKLYGAHNGIIYNARESAKNHDRTYTVDSKELFELLADGEDISKLEGYGVITWIDPADKYTIRFARLTEHSELVVVKIVEGGYAYASTKAIVEAALYKAGLTIDHYYKIKIGKEHTLNKDGFFVHDKVERKISQGYSYFSGFDDGEWPGGLGYTISRYGEGYGGISKPCPTCGFYYCKKDGTCQPKEPTAICSACSELTYYDHIVIGEQPWHFVNGRRCEGVWAPISSVKPANEQEMELLAQMEKEWDERDDDAAFMEEWRNRFLKKGS